MQILSEDNFKVLIRVRPLNSREKEQIQAYQQSHSKKMKGSAGKMIKMSPAAYSFYTKFYNCNIDQIIKIQKKTHTIAVADPQYKNTDRRMKPYIFSGVYDVQDKNKLIFTNDLKDHVAAVLQGYNCTILAYGITGSGKTYTVFGPTSKRYTNLNSNFNTFNTNLGENDQQQIEGISFLTFQFLLKEKIRLQNQKQIKVNFKLSFVQIYNENVRDLLTQRQKQNNKFLNIVEDYKGNTTISDVTQVTIESIQQISHCISIGNAKRAFASTMANQYSSRSHAILQLTVQIQKPNFQKTFSKLYIIDLAGSQKLQTLNCIKKMQEGANINRSLLALGNCINTLAQNSRKNIVTHIPYRDSKLTRMLKDSLGGNTKTIMIACISPNPFLIDETMTTLNYALRAQGIKKKIMKNQIDCQQKQQFLCLRCKKSSKVEQQLTNNQQKKSNKSPLIEKDLNPNFMRQSLDLNAYKNKERIQRKRFQQKLHIVQNVYEDIVSNIREGESIKGFGNGYIANDPQWLKIKCINQQQRTKLKQLLIDTFKSLYYQNQRKNVAFSLQNTDRFPKLQKMYTYAQENENKQNLEIGKQQTQTKSLGQSKCRRRKSHNKFQVVNIKDKITRDITSPPVFF